MSEPFFLPADLDFKSVTCLDNSSCEMVELTFQQFFGAVQSEIIIQFNSCLQAELEREGTNLERKMIIYNYLSYYYRDYLDTRLESK